MSLVEIWLDINKNGREKKEKKTRIGIDISGAETKEKRVCYQLSTSVNHWKSKVEREREREREREMQGMMICRPSWRWDRIVFYIFRLSEFFHFLRLFPSIPCDTIWFDLDSMICFDSIHLIWFLIRLLNLFYCFYFFFKHTLVLSLRVLDLIWFDYLIQDLIWF